LVCLLFSVAIISGCDLAGPTEGSNPEGDSFEWPVSTPAEQGLRADLLERAADEVSATDYIYSLLVARNGYLVSETYANGVDSGSLTLTYSATKSVTSALIGIALQEGFIDSLDQRVLDIFPEYDYQEDERKGNITVRHLLTMQAGFDHETNIGAVVNAAPDMVAAIFESELRFEPGTDFLYSTHGSHILSAIITKTTGMYTEAYAELKLFSPIGVESFAWHNDQTGIPFGGAGLYLTARDMARYGQLYLQGGSVDRRRVVPAEWVTLSTRNHRAYTEPWEEMDSVGYGFQWWTGTVRDYPLYFASGFGGQWIVVIPTADMVVVSTMNALTETDDWQQMEFLIELLDQSILPAVVN
jgi:CubicO group peptidase (beta-lactamase class C family)